VLEMDPVEFITTDELKQQIEAGEKFELVDVREDEEVAEGMIPGAKHIRMMDIPANLEHFDRNKEYTIICRSGSRSENVCYYLRDQGYKVRNMVGGMLYWRGKVE
jgi:rhodanese-related sulfurtransferase